MDKELLKVVSILKEKYSKVQVGYASHQDGVSYFYCHLTHGNNLSGHTGLSGATGYAEDEYSIANAIEMAEKDAAESLAEADVSCIEDMDKQIHFLQRRRNAAQQIKDKQEQE